MRLCPHLRALTRVWDYLLAAPTAHAPAGRPRLGLEPLEVRVVPAAVADSQPDFAGTQGAGGWQYGRVAGTVPNPPTSAFTPFGHFTGTAWTVSSTQTNPFLTAGGGHPGFTGTYTGQWPVRRWTSTYTGLVTLSGSAQDTQAGGDGTAVRVYQNGAPVYVCWFSVKWKILGLGFVNPESL